MAKIINTGGYPKPTAATVTTSVDTYDPSHPKPASGGGGTK
jgi:hypothetical protein